MIVLKRSVSRREMLRGLGAAVALPMLDSMIPAFSARAATATPSNRFGVVYVPNGMIMENYLPSKEGPDYEITPTLSALQPFREHFQILSGLTCVPTPGRPGGAHAKASTRFLTDISPPTSETWLDAGISVDQILAQQIGKETQIASLELGIESGETAGSCDTGYACPYTNTLSWTGPSSPLPTQNDPRLVFERLFSDMHTTNPKERAARTREQKSLLDSVNAEAARLGRTLPAADRTKLSEYLDAVRGIERRIQIAEQQNRELPEVERPAGIPASWEDHLKLMFDLMVVAYQSDMTRVVTLMLGHEQSGMTYPQIGVPDAHHPISHHQREPEKVAKTAKINAYHVKMFTYLLDKLRTTSDGDGTLMDHVTMIYGAGIADSNSHAPVNIPFVLAGGGVGNLKGGRHTHLKDVPLANLHLTLMDQFGVKRESMGDSTGRVDPAILRLG
jgi:hypothetical protein